jgi:hypothetical protein
MFYCEACRAKNDWPGTIIGSRGTCEVCGKGPQICHDVPTAHLPKPSPIPENPQMPSKASDTAPATQALPDRFGPQEALQEAIQSGAVAHWASGGAILRRRRGMEQKFYPFHDKPDFLSTAFEWEMAPAIEHPATPEALLQIMLSVLKESDGDARHCDNGVTQRDEARVGLDRLAAKLGLKQWKGLADKCCE